MPIVARSDLTGLIGDWDGGRRTRTGVPYIRSSILCGAVKKVILIVQQQQ